MNNPSTKLCPKCGKPFVRIAKFNSDYNIYIHKQKEDHKGLYGLIEYCIVTTSHVYNPPKIIADGLPLNPAYRSSKP